MTTRVLYVHNQTQRSESMAALDLPPELWRMILKDLHRTDTLASVSLTCRYLHSIAQTFIFRYFCLSHIRTGNDLSRQIARLGFYSSDLIAPHVHDLSIYVCDHLYTPDFAKAATLFFNALSRFLNTRSLVCAGIRFTQLSLQQISSLPSLESLEVMGCTLPLHIDQLPILHPRTFVYSGNRLAHHWLALLDPDYLQALRFLLTPDICAFFLSNKNPSLHPFPSLHTIDCSVDQRALPFLPQLFAKTPALRCLKLSLFNFYPAEAAQYIRIMERFQSTLPCSVPFLEEYKGAHDLLSLVLGRAVKHPSAHLRCLDLESPTRGGDPLDAFVNVLRSCHPLQLRNLTHLRICRLKSADFKSLATLQDMLPALQLLRIHSSSHYLPEVYMYNVQLTDLYTLALPRNLVSLSIQWSSDTTTTCLPSLVAAKDSLIPRLPSLRRLWLCDLSKLALLWSLSAMGKEERCSLYEVGSEDRISSAWKMRVTVFPGEPTYMY